MADNDPVGRPRRRRKEARPAEIIEAGVQVFGEHGFAGARLDEVAARAGVAKGTIYLYFENKEALFIAAVRSRIRPVFVDVRLTIDSYDGPTADLIAALLRSIYQRLIVSDMSGLLRVIIAEGPKFPEIAEFYHRETISEGRGLIGRIVARGLARGDVRPGPAAEMPIVIIGPVVMALVWRLVFDPIEPLDLDRFLAAHLDLVTGGLCVPAGDHSESAFERSGSRFA